MVRKWSAARSTTWLDQRSSLDLVEREIRMEKVAFDLPARPFARPNLVARPGRADCRGCSVLSDNSYIVQEHHLVLLVCSEAYI